MASLEFIQEKIGSNKIKRICDHLQNNLRILSITECSITEQSFRSLMKSVSQSNSLLKLSLNVDMLKDLKRVQVFCQALQRNRTILSLSISGNPIGDKGMSLIGPVLSQHPHVVSLDVGDCDLGEDSLKVIADLLPPNGTKPGLKELTLSGNTAIKPMAWVRFSLALSLTSQLRELNVDYNLIGDQASSCLIIGVAAGGKIETLDLEATKITNHTVELLLHLLENYPVRLKKITLDENRISKGLLEAIHTSISWHDDGESNQSVGDSETGSITQDNGETIHTSREVDVRVPILRTNSMYNEDEDESSSEEEDDEDEEENSLPNQNSSDFKGTATSNENFKILAKAIEDREQSEMNNASLGKKQDLPRENNTENSQKSNLVVVGSSEEKEDENCEKEYDEEKPRTNVVMVTSSQNGPRQTSFSPNRPASASSAQGTPGSRRNSSSSNFGNTSRPLGRGQGLRPGPHTGQHVSGMPSRRPMSSAADSRRIAGRHDGRPISAQ